MLKKTATLLVATLILLQISIVAMSTIPKNIITAQAALENDMPVVVIVDEATRSSAMRAEVGETFTIRVEVFNLTATEYLTDDLWVDGEPLPPKALYGRYKYLLGDLWALDMRLQWDPTILEYVRHTAMIPVENYTGGILNGPVVEPNDDVDPVAGTYWLSRSSYGDATPFNAPGQNATTFTMTFTVKNPGKCDIRFTKLDLVVYPYPSPGLPTLQNVVPHWTIEGQFRTGTVLTRVESVQAGALVAGLLYHPVIEDEDVTVRIAMRNDNDTVTDTYDLTLFDGTTVLSTWEDETLDPEATRMYNYTAEGLGVGLHPLKAEATILHAGEIKTSEAARNVTVVKTPTLQINGPSSAETGQTISFSASGSVHNDPDGAIVTYTWTLWSTGDPVARDTQTGEGLESVSFELPPQTEKIGNWTVMLVVTDNFGITARQPSETSPLGVAPTPTSDLLRPATTWYRKTWTLDVRQSAPPGLNLEWILLIVILVVVIAAAVFYIRRRQR